MSWCALLITLIFLSVSILTQQNFLRVGLIEAESNCENQTRFFAPGQGIPVIEEQQESFDFRSEKCTELPEHFLQQYFGNWLVYFHHNLYFMIWCLKNIHTFYVLPWPGHAVSTTYRQSTASTTCPRLSHAMPQPTPLRAPSPRLWGCSMMTHWGHSSAD